MQKNVDVDNKNLTLIKECYDLHVIVNILGQLGVQITIHHHVLQLHKSTPPQGRGMVTRPVAMVIPFVTMVMRVVMGTVGKEQHGGNGEHGRMLGDAENEEGAPSVK